MYIVALRAFVLSLIALQPFVARSADLKDPAQNMESFLESYHNLEMSVDEQGTEISNLYAYSDKPPIFRGPYTGGILTNKTDIEKAWANFFTKNPTAKVQLTPSSQGWPEGCLDERNGTDVIVLMSDLGAADKKFSVTHNSKIKFQLVDGYGCKISYFCIWAASEKENEVCP